MIPEVTEPLQAVKTQGHSFLFRPRHLRRPESFSGDDENPNSAARFSLLHSTAATEPPTRVVLSPTMLTHGEPGKQKRSSIVLLVRSWQGRWRGDPDGNWAQLAAPWVAATR